MRKPVAKIIANVLSALLGGYVIFTLDGSNAEIFLAASIFYFNGLAHDRYDMLKD